MGQGTSGLGVGHETGRCDGGSGDVGAEARILGVETRGAPGGLRVEGCKIGCWSVSVLTGRKVVRRFEGGADRQVLFICHDSQSISHQAVGHTSICLFSDSTVDKQYKLNIVQ